MRFSTGINELDEALGGGLRAGSMTIVAGATGVGKTQLGLQLAQSARRQEGVGAAVIDLSSRGDSQNHVDYAQQMFGEPLSVADFANGQLQHPFQSQRPADVLPFLGYSGRRVLRSQMDVDQWHAWQSELNHRMPQLFRFVYNHLIHGTRRFIIDGIEPQEDPGDSLQLDLLELIYHRMLRTEHDWLAREVLREKFRENESRVAAHAFDHREAMALVLVTTKSTMLEQLMTEPLADGDLAAGANTILLLGRIRDGARMRRGLYIVKHRGSYAHEHILPFDIDDRGLNFSQ